MTHNSAGRSKHQHTVQGVDLDRIIADTARLHEKLLLMENNTMTGTGFSTLNTRTCKEFWLLGLHITSWEKLYQGWPKRGSSKLPGRKKARHQIQYVNEVDANFLVNKSFFFFFWLRCPETSVRNYHYSLRNSPEERSSHLLRSGSLKARKFFFVYQ
jgi:hypothetical protein